MTATTLPANLEERHKFLAGLVADVHSGKSIRQIADAYGIAKSTINNWLLSKVPAEYQPAKEAGIVARITEAAENLEDAHDHVDISRAREVARLWCWIAERQVGSFAPKQEISGPGGGAIVIEDRELARRFAFINAMAQRSTIDAEVIEEQPADHKP